MEDRHGSSQCKEGENEEDEEKNGQVTSHGDSELYEVFWGAECNFGKLKILWKNNGTE